MVRGCGLGRAGLVEALSEGVKGDPATAAELGVGQTAAAEISEEGIPAKIEGVAPGHGVFSLTGPSDLSGYDRGRSPGFPDALHRTDTVVRCRGEDHATRRGGWSVVFWGNYWLSGAAEDGDQVRVPLGLG
jgi:hypothetical protein